MGSLHQRALIFLHGEEVQAWRWRPLLEGALLVAADGGAGPLLAVGIQPDLLLGDFDSLAGDLLEKARQSSCEVRTFPRDKDQTDGEIALEYALEQGLPEIVLVGGWGGRVDHALANVALLARVERAGKWGYLLNQASRIYLVSKILTLAGKPGQIFSLLPLEPCRGVSLQGGAYSLHSANLSLGETRGLSNVFLGEWITVQKEKGLLLAILLDGEEGVEA